LRTYEGIAGERRMRRHEKDMPQATNYVKIEFPSLAENVKFARTAVAVFAADHFESFTIDEIDEIKVATSEAVSNAIVHGYGHGGGVVRLIVTVEDGALVVVVEDDGKGIEDVEWAKQPTNTTAPGEHMGLGLVFINEYMTDVTITSRPGKGTRVRMKKAPARSATSRRAL